MNREIKFRGKTGVGFADRSKWVYGDLLTPKPDDEKYYICFVDEEGDTICNEVDPATVGQYTGLKDKNGVEIYEGDIIDTTIKAQRMMFVAWDEGALTWGLVDPKSGHRAGDGYLDATMSYIEVIGNIYDNPELLKEKQ